MISSLIVRSSWTRPLLTKSLRPSLPWGDREEQALTPGNWGCIPELLLYIPYRNFDSDEFKDPEDQAAQLLACYPQDSSEEFPSWFLHLFLPSQAFPGAKTVNIKLAIYVNRFGHPPNNLAGG
jgi:hypothetical protein